MNLRLLALSGVVVCAVALPLAVASAGQVGDGGRAVVRDLVHPAAGPLAHDDSVRPSARSAREREREDGRSGTGDDGRSVSGEDHKEPVADVSRSPLLLGLGLATAARCGPELTSPDGIEAQTCVLTQGAETWARTYYRNATGGALDAVLTLMGPRDRTLQMHCAIGADDEPDLCETTRERTRGDLDAYTAVAEFAGRADDGPLLLRSGSNSGADTGS
ncbi:hypothetical protein ABZ896_08280 [Streptomyces sp. NPDC047072]|uniref:hypothetical protein n=1 Tax=Streptomyces sp. NPDC047072 TaxID=3154809 RepID=UPI0033E74C68